MAEGKKTGGKDFQPGQSGNPAGRPAQPAELRQAKTAMKNDFEASVTRLVRMSFADLKTLVADQSNSALELSIASILLKGISLGDPGRINFLLDRIVGPVAKTVELTGPDGEPLAPVVAMSSQELTVTLVAIQKLMKEKEWNFPQNLPRPSESLPASSRRGSPTVS